MDDKRKELTAQFLITELEGLYQGAVQYKQQIVSKVNFFLAILTAATGGIFLAITNDVASDFDILVAICLLSGFLLALGGVVFHQMLELVALKRIAYRRAARIRKWFSDFDPTIRDYLPYGVSDENPPLFVSEAPFRGIEALLVFLLSALVSVFVSTSLYIAYWRSGMHNPPLHNSRVILFSITLAFFFVIGWKIQKWYVGAYFRKIEIEERRRGEIHFPRDST